MTTPTQARPASCAATQNDRHGALFCCPLKYGHFGRHDWQRVTAAPAKAQEPDALVQRLRHFARCGHGTPELGTEAADRIELLERQPNLLPALAELQAQHEADAAELKRQNDANDMLGKERDAFQARAATLQAQHEADAALIAELREYKAMYEGLCK